MENTNYKFIQVPLILGMLMDNYCLTVFSKLLMLSFINKGDTFTCTNQNLQNITGLSKKVLNATLSSLHRNGLITVECVGISKSKLPNRITIHRDKFKDYDDISVGTVFFNEEQRIVIDRYDVKGYRVSYLPIEEAEKEIKQQENVSKTFQIYEEEGKEEEQPVTATATVHATPTEETEELDYNPQQVFEVPSWFKFNNNEESKKVENEEKSKSEGNTTNKSDLSKIFIDDDEETDKVPTPNVEQRNTVCSDTEQTFQIATVSADTAEQIVKVCLANGYEFNLTGGFANFLNSTTNYKAIAFAEKELGIKTYRPVWQEVYKYLIKNTATVAVN